MEKNKKHANETEAQNNNGENAIDASDFSVEEITNLDDVKRGNPEHCIPAEETQKLRSELEEQRDKYVRLFAEFDNYKRRTSRERMELMQTAGSEVMVSMFQF